jgi:hypothetical protein
MQMPPAFLPETAPGQLQAREERRISQSISREEALAAGWSREGMLAMNQAAWDMGLIAGHLKSVRERGLCFWYHIGTNDNVCPGQLALGRLEPQFPAFFQPGGQHGGPASIGFTLQTPTQPEAEDNLRGLVMHHFFGGRALPPVPGVEIHAVENGLRVKALFPKGSLVERSRVHWCLRRSPEYTYAFEFDSWQELPMTAAEDGVWIGEIPISDAEHQIDWITTHRHHDGDLPMHVSSAYQRWTR